MKPRLTEAQLRELGGVLHLTRPEELTCEEWVDHVGAYAEALAAGLPAPVGADLVAHHLAICPECKEEFDALVLTLRDGAA